MIRLLQQRSGLTWSELARALGVSRRAVHHWATGQRLSEQHARRVEEFAILVSSLGSMTPDETRAILITPGADGRSKLSIFGEASQPRRLVPLSTLTVGDFFAGEDINAAAPVVIPNRRSTLAPRSIPLRGGGAGTQ